MKRVFILFLSLFLTSTFTVDAQPNVLLSNGIVKLSDNLDAFHISQSELHNNKAVRIIQFNAIPNATQLGRIRNAGIDLLEYIPHNTYVANIASHVNGKTLQSLGVRSAVVPDEVFKLSSNLFKNQIPEHADMGNGRIEIVIVPYKGIRATEVIVTVNQLPYFDVLSIPETDDYIEAICRVEDLNTLVANHLISFIQEAEVPGEPENNTAITSHRINTTNGTNAPAYGYTGSGVRVSLGDNGAIGPHIDYEGRLDQSRAGASNGDHGDHVAGTIFGAGNRNPRGRGMAPGAEILYYTYPANLNNTVSDYNNDNIKITSSSFSNGCNAGYTNFARNMDLTSHQLYSLLHVFSAGNNGTSDCSYGAGGGWGNITGGHKLGKNVIAVANVTRLDNIASSSSRGPASDGRLKPEVAAVGTQVFSTTFPHTYTTKTGTSMACPGVAGALTLLYEAYEDQYNDSANGGLMKAVLMNGSDDLGNPGPDFIYGYGRINIRKSLRMLDEEWFTSGTVGQNDSTTHTITVPSGASSMRVMLYWVDREGSLTASKALVNDLDLTLQQGANTFLPLTLNPTPNVAALSANATPGIDTLNNSEQIVISNPAAGTASITVKGTAIPFGTQDYYVVYYFEDEDLTLTHPVGGETFIPGSSEIIRWDANSNSGNFILQYSTNAGNSWVNINTSIAGSARHFTWTPPTTTSDQIRVRITRGTQNSESGNFVIAATPNNLGFASICPDTTSLSWNPVSNAKGYVVYKLGTMYMDSIGYTTNTTFDVPNVSAFDEHWYSVAAVADSNGVGRRAVAVLADGSGLFNCIVDNDIAAGELISPPKGLIPSCLVDTLPIELWIYNNGINPINDFTISYDINGGSVTSDSITQSIAPGDSILFTSPSSIIPIGGVTNNIRVWLNIPNDESARNDTAYTKLDVYGTGSVSVPFVQDFESDNNCSTASNCEQEVCNLTLGFINAENGTFDDIDWRVNNGTTPSNNTGPGIDNTLGTSSGKYIYLEATQCFNKVSELYTPCIDLNGSSAPILEFYHHRRGNSVGPLHIDIFHEGQWKQLMPSITTTTGTPWVRYDVSLVPYVGEKIAIRFTGETIGSWQGDIALDDISVIESTEIPNADFSSSDIVACPNIPITFFDESTGAANTWEWVFSPSAGVSAAPGSSLTEQNPSVLFQNVGVYDVTLIASNNNGSDTLTQTMFIEITNGDTIPYFGIYTNNLPGDVLPNWHIENPDNDETWERVPSLINPVSNSAVRMDNFSYDAQGERDHLITPPFDLNQSQNAYLVFDYAYAPFNINFTDSLEISVAVGCDAGFDSIVYINGGMNFSSIGGSQNSMFVPNANQWSSDTVDLSSFTGNSIRIRFTNINGFGNAMYLNNFRVVDTLMDAPIVDLSASTTDGCVGNAIIFSQTSSSATSFQWSFGANASPATATGPGPHSVTYGATGTRNATVIASNSAGQSQDVVLIDVLDRPFAAFQESISQLTVDFTDASIGSPTSWIWDFGDGDSAFVQNPQHTYAASGTYSVTLRAINDCGSRTFIRSITVEGLSNSSFNAMPDWNLYPNPGKGTFTVDVPSKAQVYRIQLIDMGGQTLKDELITQHISEKVMNINNLSSGVYLVRVYHQFGVKTFRYTLSAE